MCIVFKKWRYVSPKKSYSRVYISEVFHDNVCDYTFVWFILANLDDKTERETILLCVMLPNQVKVRKLGVSVAQSYCDTDFANELRLVWTWALRVILSYLACFQESVPFSVRHSKGASLICKH